MYAAESTAAACSRDASAPAAASGQGAYRRTAAGASASCSARAGEGGRSRSAARSTRAHGTPALISAHRASPPALGLDACTPMVAPHAQLASCCWRWLLDS
jgi:hypothetical protein